MCLSYMSFSESVVFKSINSRFQQVDVAVRMSSWSSDDNKLAVFFIIHTLMILLWLLLVLQHLTNPSFMVLKNLVRRHGESFVLHLLKPGINWCL